MHKSANILFFILASVFVVSLLFKPYPSSWLIKILPMVLLISIAWQASSKSKLVISKLFTLGLAFSACGDFILDVNREHWFIFGLGAFFIAHLFYLASLKPFTISFSKKNIMVLLSYTLYGVIMLSILAEGLGDLLIPVIGYMTILLLMALATVLSKKSNRWLIIGGISFVLSDSLIGFDKFYMPIENVHIAIMISYYFAQYALLKGFLNSNKI